MLTSRLLTAAGFVPENVVLADIGTDHANLPIYLLKTGRIKNAIAVDVHEGPYQTAKRAVREQGMETWIDVRLGDGLSALRPGEADVAVFAGMGGLLINSLLEKSPQVTAALHGLVLQPQLACEKVRRYIYDIGWHIEDEALAKEQHHIYQLIYAVPGQRDMPDELVLTVGPILLAKKQALFKYHIAELLRRSKKMLAGYNLARVQRNDEQHRKLSALIKSLEMMSDDKMPDGNGGNGTDRTTRSGGGMG
ncbi:tRNA (adenine(22)-N(1))-methyltransferase [Pectinatus haikarae]|uniref:tRNA (adenine(22)-N(1))-methyltransferase n=1 Tax=Pectinatus haikarae TaxID=349096 RepID=UPI0018C4C486|nr:class I SAM-dependent methyltransferase [Pectinatus haikarae]